MEIQLETKIQSNSKVLSARCTKLNQDAVLKKCHLQVLSQIVREQEMKDCTFAPQLKSAE